MILFWTLLATITLIVLAIVILPIYFHPREKIVSAQALSKEIYQDRLEALKEELVAKNLTQSEYDVVYAEQGRAFLEEQNELNHEETKQGFSLPLTIIIILFVSAFSLSMYFKYGESAQFSEYLLAKKNAQQVQEEIQALGSIDNIIQQMEESVQQNQDAQGFYLLGRLYMRAQRFNEAVDAFNQSNQLLPNQPETLSSYAEALYFANQQKLNHQGRILLQQALNLNPNLPDALNLLAIDAYERGRYEEAIAAWEKLRVQLPQNNQQTQDITNMIEKAQAQLHQQTKSLQAHIKLPVSVGISESLKNQIDGSETLFIYAKALKGSNAPLSIIKAQAKDLPIQVVLDETMAMLSMATLLDADEIIIVARISKTGEPTAQAGDFEGESQIIELKAIPSQTVVVIDSVL